MSGTQRMYPGAILSLTVNGRTYNGANSTTAVFVDPVDVPMLTANGWVVVPSIVLAQGDAPTLAQGVEADVAALLSTVQPITQNAGASGNVSWNLSAGYKATLLMTGSANMLAPTNIPAAGRGVLVVTQNAASFNTCTFNSIFHAGGANMTLTATNGAVDMFALEFDSTRIFVTNALKNVG